MSEPLKDIPRARGREGVCGRGLLPGAKGGAARSEAGKFVMDLAAPTHTYADRLREAFYQSSLLHPLLHPAPDCRAHLLRGDDRMVANLPRGFPPGRVA